MPPQQCCCSFLLWLCRWMTADDDVFWSSRRRVIGVLSGSCWTAIGAKRRDDDVIFNTIPSHWIVDEALRSLKTGSCQGRGGLCCCCSSEHGGREAKRRWCGMAQCLSFGVDDGRRSWSAYVDEEGEDERVGIGWFGHCALQQRRIWAGERNGEEVEGESSLSLMSL